MAIHHGVVNLDHRNSGPTRRRYPHAVTIGDGQPDSVTRAQPQCALWVSFAPGRVSDDGVGGLTFLNALGGDDVVVLASDVGPNGLDLGGTTFVGGAGDDHISPINDFMNADGGAGSAKRPHQVRPGASRPSRQGQIGDESSCQAAGKADSLWSAQR